TLIDSAALRANKSITPEQVVDVLALMGDTVDNIPGVEGIGPKTAAQLIQQDGSIEGVFAHIAEIKDKRRGNHAEDHGHCPSSRQLATLERHGTFPFALEAARVRSPDLNRLLVLFQQLGFNRFQQEAQRLADSQTLVPAAEPSDAADPLDAFDPFSPEQLSL